jgi:hypothetical protein
MSNKSFAGDIKYFRDKLNNNENFSFSKYADGEWAVMKNVPLNNKEFWFDPNNDNDQLKRQSLIQSFKYKHPNYYVGISCPCCQGMDIFNEMYNFSEQQSDHLTWANLWVNSNYRYYLNEVLPLFNKKPVVLFCNNRGNISNLPFTPHMVFPVENNAWANNWDTINMAKQLIVSQNIKDMIFLFCCGPFGNILCHQLTEVSDQNTYLDIGSTLNPFLESAGFERHYYMGDNIYSRLTCSWGK